MKNNIYKIISKNIFIIFSMSMAAFLFIQPVKAAPKNILFEVPFSSQAPLGEWKDERQQDACEEAVSLMAIAWLKPVKIGQKKISLSKVEWRNRIITLSDWEQKKYKEYRDLSLVDMRDWIFKDYFSYNIVMVKKVKSATDIVQELERGNLVLMPMNGQALKNPNFTSPGPERHMILIKGYDYATKQFITNDPGTRRGENYRYGSDTLFKAIRAYKTGNKVVFDKNIIKEMLVVSR